jgi:hypothetical protein
VTTTTTEMLTTATTSLLTTTSSVTTTETTTSGTTTTMTITVGTGTPSCLGAGGGHSVGFWTSKDGQTKVNDDGGAGAELALLAGLNLKNADGSDFSPASYNELKSWLQKANSPNMAYKLSSALAVMALNVEAGFVDGSSPVYAPGVPGANASGFISITDLMNTANSALGNDGYTPSGDTNRLVQEVMLKALDDANNNTNFANHAHSTPTGC